MQYNRWGSDWLADKKYIISYKKINGSTPLPTPFWSGGTFSVDLAQDLITLRNAVDLGATIHLVSNTNVTSNVLAFITAAEGSMPV